MATYTLKVDIDKTWISQYNKPGSTMALCLAFGVAEAAGVEPNFNVVAAFVPGGQNKLSNSVTFTWTERYQMAATQQSFQNGVRIDATTTALDIEYGQHYALAKDWSGGDVDNDPKAPDNGFLFTIPKGNKATGVIYKPVASSASGGSLSMQPFYVSANGPLPAGNETLIPIITAQVWFQSITQSSTMWDGYSGEVMKVTYPVVSPIFMKEVNFNASGSWGNGPLS